MSVTVMCLVLLIVAPAGHHSVTATFDRTSRFDITGTLVKVDWRNPHIELSLDVVMQDGALQKWVIESFPPIYFRNRSVGKSDFENAIGRTLFIQGIRARDGSTSGVAGRITFPDGNVVTLSQ